MLKWLQALLDDRESDDEGEQDAGPFPPEVLVIPHDDHHGRWVGRLPGGDGLFITTPFTFGAKPEDSREFLAAYRFSAQGDLIEARIEALGTRADLVGEARARRLPGNVAEETAEVSARIKAWIDEHPGFEPGDILAKPFSIERHGIRFGLIPDAPEDFDEGEPFEPVYVTLQPGDYMAFMAPWQGEYDT